MIKEIRKGHKRINGVNLGSLGARKGRSIWKRGRGILLHRDQLCILLSYSLIRKSTIFFYSIIHKHTHSHTHKKKEKYQSRYLYLLFLSILLILRLFFNRILNFETMIRYDELLLRLKEHVF